jgi:hypothetical protein
MPLHHDQLLDLYKVAVDEYRFQVKLGWDRAMYYMVFNTAIISVGTGMLKPDNPPAGHRLIAAIFLVGFCSSLVGWWAIRKGHEYYRRTVVKKTLLEDMLGLTTPLAEYPYRHTLAVGTTAGQSDHLKILSDPEQWVNRGMRGGSITFLLSAILILLAVINLGGLATSVWLSFHPTNHFKSVPPLVFPATV